MKPSGPRFFSVGRLLNTDWIPILVIDLFKCFLHILVLVHCILLGVYSFVFWEKKKGNQKALLLSGVLRLSGQSFPNDHDSYWGGIWLNILLESIAHCRIFLRLFLDIIFLFPTFSSHQCQTSRSLLLFSFGKDYKGGLIRKC